MNLDPPPRNVADLAGLGGRASVGAGGPHSSMRKFLGICLLVVVACGPAGLAGRVYQRTNPTPVQRARVTAAVVGKRSQTITAFVLPPDAPVGVPVTLSASATSGLSVSFTSDTPLVCTVSRSTVTTTAPGTCVITASQGGSKDYAPAPDVARSFPVKTGQKRQEITFAQPPDALVGVPVTLSASATSGLPVSFTSDAPLVCTVSGSTVVTAAPGTCVITASQGGSKDYAPAPDVARSFPVKTGQKGQEITFAQPPDALVGVPVTLSASATSGLPVSFTSDAPLVCTVSGSTVVTAAPGTCVITASQGGSKYFAPAPDVARSFPVGAGKNGQEIETFVLPPDALVGVPVTLSASATSGLPVSFTSDAPLVCTVSGSTVVTAAAGVCVITASQGGSKYFAPAPDVARSFPVSAGKNWQEIKFAQPPDALVGVPVTLSASATSGLPVSFTSDVPQVCNVSGTTVVTLAPGTCVIIASQGGSKYYAPAPHVARSFAVKPGLAAQTITFAQPPDALVGVRVTLFASATSGLPVSFGSDTPLLCTVLRSTVTTRAPGTCVITASQGGSKDFLPAPDVARSFSVKPGPAAQTITFAQPPDALVGAPVTLSASATSGLPVSFASDTPLVCTVSRATVRTRAPGTCLITASQGGSRDYAPAPDVARSFPVHAAHRAQTITFAEPPAATVGAPVTLSASASSGLPVSFGSDTPLVCTVSGTIVVTAVPGTCVITASQGGSPRYAAAPDVTRFFPVQAGLAAQTITFARPPTAKVGAPVTLSASASSGLPVSFGSDTPRVCTVSGTTVVTAAAGVCVITASQGGSNAFAPAPDVTRSFPVQAGLAAQTITFAQPPAAKVGAPVTLSASATSSLPVSLISDTPQVCTVSGTVVVTEAPGTCVITASQGGSPRYAPAPAVTHSFRVEAVASNGTGALLILLAAAVPVAAGLLMAVRRRRLRSHPQAAAPTVQVATETGPPASVSVHETGTGVTHTVRIEPSPGNSITTIEEAGP